MELARRQHADLVSAVRGLNIDVLELPPDETNALSVFTQDLAVVVNGIALMCRPVNSTRKPEVQNSTISYLKKLAILIRTFL